jgi:hypothetical protein
LTKNLTPGQKKKWFSEICERDNGFKCYYCQTNLELNHYVFDHLNCKREDNRIDNLVLACQSCNIKRITDGALYEKGFEKLKENEDRLFVRENVSDERLEPVISKEIDINTKNSEITESFLENTLKDSAFVLFSEALDACVYLCKKQTSHGSHQSVRNYLAALTSIVGPFEIVRNDKNKKIIRKRNSN